MKKSTNRNSVSNQAQPTTATKMAPWKQALVTAVAVYPLLLFYERLVSWLPFTMDRNIAMLLVVILIAFTMVFIVMPLVIQLLGKWLYKH